MTYVLVLIVGAAIGAGASWIAHDPAGAKQLWQDFRDLLAKARK